MKQDLTPFPRKESRAFLLRRRHNPSLPIPGVRQCTPPLSSASPIHPPLGKSEPGLGSLLREANWGGTTEGDGPPF